MSWIGRLNPGSGGRFTVVPDGASVSRDLVREAQHHPVLPHEMRSHRRAASVLLQHTGGRIPSVVHSDSVRNEMRQGGERPPFRELP